jgi:predicted membrane protein
MSPDNRSRFSSHLVLGAIAILFGLIFLLHNLGYIADVHAVLRFWPVLLVVFGLLKAYRSEAPWPRSWGLIIAGVGVVMLLNRAGILSIDVWAFWPLLLVLLGGSIIWQSTFIRRRAESGASGSETESTVIGTAIMGGFKRANASQDFRGGELTAIMGGVELDLRQAAIRGGDAVLNVFAFWGGVELRVPREWTVVMQGTPILGGYEDKTFPPQSSSAPRLVIKGSAIMGGVEITN